MLIPCAIETDSHADPKIKITKDAPSVTLTVYCEDLNLLKSLVDKEIFLSIPDK